MGQFDLDTYQLCQQLLSGQAQASTGGQEGPAGAPDFFQPSPSQAPMLRGDDQWVVDPAGYVADDGFSDLPQPLQIPGGGVWAGSGDGFVHVGGADWAGIGHEVPQGEAWAAAAEDSMMPDGGGVPSLQEMLMGGVDLSEFMSDAAAVNSLWASAMMDSLAANHPSIYAQPPNQPASDSSGPSTQFGAAESPGMTSRMPAYPPTMEMGYPQAPPAASVNIPQPVPVPDSEDAEVAQMVRAAARCGDDKASTAWSEEENRVLRDGLSRFASQDNVTKCFSIASGLASKTVLDVAYRIRWLSDLEKKRAAKAEKSAETKVTKGKGTKGATRKNNRYPLSKEVLDSRSAKDLIRDNDRLMDKIEEILRTGQLKNSPDYFYYVKMNMDTLLNKVTDVATVMEGLSVDDEEWADVLKDRSSSA